MQSIFDYTFDDLVNYLNDHNIKKFKANQIFDWLYKKRVFDYDNMSNINLDLRNILKDNLDIEMLELVKKQTSKDTNKYLFRLKDGNLIEAVLMKHDYGNSLCVSSQVGCNMGCRFCESGRLKKIRNLETNEMVKQILMVENEEHLRISSVVVMGIGEPFDNYDNLIRFLKIINDDKGIAIGARHITVSTCGIVPKIKEYADLNTQFNLALSLHAPNNKLRSELMLINRAYNIDDVMEALKYYIKKTNRRVTIEYIMLKDVNDTKECALELAQLLNGMLVYVNLIPYNETSHIEFKKSDKIMEFYDVLKKNGINVTVRREFGGQIDAACGQLRAKEVEK